MRRWTWLPSTDYGHTPALHNLYQRLADMLTPFTSYYHFPITLTFQLCQHSLLGKTCQVQRVFQSNSLRSPLHQLAFGTARAVCKSNPEICNLNEQLWSPASGWVSKWDTPFYWCGLADYLETHKPAELGRRWDTGWVKIFVRLRSPLQGEKQWKRPLLPPISVLYRYRSGYRQLANKSNEWILWEYVFFLWFWTSDSGQARANRRPDKRWSWRWWRRKIAAKRRDQPLGRQWPLLPSEGRQWCNGRQASQSTGRYRQVWWRVWATITIIRLL